MRKICLLFCLAFLVLQGASAQKKGKETPKDFIITNSGDTVWGKFVGNMIPAITAARIVFMDDAKGEKTTYKPYDIRSWHPGGLPFHYESKEYRPKGMKAEEQGYGVFMKCFTPYDGAVKLYEFYNADSQEGYTQTFLQKRGEMTEVVYEKFYAQMTEFFSDYAELSTKIKEKKYKKTALQEIVDEYNRWKNRKV